MIVCKNEEGIKKFSSPSQASKVLNIKRSLIVNCLNGKQKTAKGYSFLKI